MKLRWKSLLGSAVFGAAVAMTGIGGLSVSAMAETVYHRGNTGEPKAMDLHKVQGIWEDNIVSDMFMGLMTEDPWGNPIKGIAQSYDVSDDGKVYTFKIRDDVVWSDGMPVTANDFVFAYRRIMDPATASEYANLLYPIENAEAINKGEITDFSKLGARAIDDKTLEVTLKAQTPYFISQLTHYTSFPLPQHVVEKYGNDWSKPENIVSNGAFVLEEWKPQVHVKLRKNDKFWDAANVKIDTIYYYPVEERTEGLKRFRAGELHTYSEFPAKQYNWLKENMPGEAKANTWLGTYYYPINTKVAPFDDVRVRRALSMAINRELIAEKVVGTGEVPAYSFVPNGVFNYTPAYMDFKDMSMEGRLAEAKKLLGEAGYGLDNPLTVELKYNTSEDHKNIAVAIASMWKDLGVEVDMLNSEVSVHYEDLRSHDFQIGRAGWIMDYNDAQNLLFLLRSDNEGLNYAQYENAEFDRLMDAAGRENDLDKRANLMKQAEAIMLQDMPYIPIYYYAARNLVSKNVKGYETVSADGSKVNVSDKHRSRWISIEE